MTVLIQFTNGPLHDHVVEFDELPRKYSVVADNVLYRYTIEDRYEETGIESVAQGDADEVLRGVEVS